MSKEFTRYPNMETLERVKRWPSLLKRFPRIRIYSAEHHAYWRGTGQGYTDQVQASAILSLEEAFAITRHCGPEKRIRFIKATDPPESWMTEAMEMQILEYESRGQHLYAGLGAPASIRFIYDKLGRAKPQDLPAISPWISVQDGLPDEGREIFFEVNHGLKLEGKFEVSGSGLGKPIFMGDSLEHWYDTPYEPVKRWMYVPE